MKKHLVDISLDTWIISDTHFFHKNIQSYCNRPDNWQKIIVQNWNGRIASEDKVLHLGDFGFGKRSHFETMVSLLNGRISLIRGNHDRLSRTTYQSLGVNIYNGHLMSNGAGGHQIVFSHRPVIPLLAGVLNLHGHIHNNPVSIDTPLGSNHINMCVEVREYRPWQLQDLLEQHNKESLQNRLESD